MTGADSARDDASIANFDAARLSIVAAGDQRRAAGVIAGGTILCGGGSYVGMDINVASVTEQPAEDALVVSEAGFSARSPTARSMRGPIRCRVRNSEKRAGVRLAISSLVRVVQ